MKLALTIFVGFAALVGWMTFWLGAAIKDDWSVALCVTMALGVPLALLAAYRAGVASRKGK